MLTVLRIQSFLLVTFIVSTLTACSTTSAAAKSTDTEKSIAALEMEMAEWKQMKPNIQRLVAVERELKGLMAQLEVITATDLDPVEQLPVVVSSDNIQADVMPKVEFTESVDVGSIPQTQPPSLTQEAVSEVTAPVVVKAEPNATEPTSLFSLQLASVTKESSVNSTWSTLKNRYGDVLGALDFHSEEVAVGERTYYRVKAGSFASYSDAKENCKALINKGASCIVSKGL